MFLCYAPKCYAMLCYAVQWFISLQQSMQYYAAAAVQKAVQRCVLERCSYCDQCKSGRSIWPARSRGHRDYMAKMWCSEWRWLIQFNRVLFNSYKNTPNKSLWMLSLSISTFEILQNKVWAKTTILLLNRYIAHVMSLYISVYIWYPYSTRIKNGTVQNQDDFYRANMIQPLP